MFFAPNRVGVMVSLGFDGTSELRVSLPNEGVSGVSIRGVEETEVSCSLPTVGRSGEFPVLGGLFRPARCINRAAAPFIEVMLVDQSYGKGRSGNAVMAVSAVDRLAVLRVPGGLLLDWVNLRIDSWSCSRLWGGGLLALTREIT